MTSIKDETTYAWPLNQPFTNSDVAGGKRSDHAKLAGLTRDELVKLIRTIDMGGQYYAPSKFPTSRRSATAIRSAASTEKGSGK